MIRFRIQQEIMIRLLSIAAACLLFSPGTSAQAQGSQGSTAKEPAKRAAPVADPVVIDQQGFKEVLAKHRGKPLMVNFWATWCEPCRDEFPMVNQLAQKYAPQGLVVVGVSLDSDAEINLVRRFLARVDPVFANYRKKPGKEEPFINSIDPDWSGAIPATFFYDPAGKQAARLVGEHSREEFESAIRQLLRRTASR